MHACVQTALVIVIRDKLTYNKWIKILESIENIIERDKKVGN